MSGAARCSWAPAHLPVVVYTRRLRDALRRRYWVRCWECDLRVGPYRDPNSAHMVARHMESASSPV